MAKLIDYRTGAYIREATEAEIEASRKAAHNDADGALDDGGAGVIEVDGRPCYVEE